MNDNFRDTPDEIRSNLSLIKGALLLLAVISVGANIFGCEKHKVIQPFKQTTQKQLVYNVQNKMPV